MTIVKYPVLDFQKSLDTFQDFVGEYNKGKPSRKRLKEAHIKMFVKVLYVVSATVYENNPLFKDTPELRKIDTSLPYKLYTNNKVLSRTEKKYKVDGDTVNNRTKRIIESGAIVKKINHGSRKDYELHINPSFLVFYDYEDKKAHATNSTIKQGVQAGLTEKTVPKNNILKEPSNNLIIAGNEINSFWGRDNLVKVEKKEDRKRHQREARRGGTSGATNNEPPHRLCHPSPITEKGFAPAVPIGPGDTPLRGHQKWNAHLFYYRMLNEIFAYRDINIGQLENTYRYVIDNYFTECTDLKSIDRLMKLYEWRIGKAKRTIERKKYRMDCIFPLYYLDKTRKGKNPNTGRNYMSFANTASWRDQFKVFKKKDKEKQKGGSDSALFDKVLVAYYEAPGLAKYNKAIAFLKERLPNMIDDFLGIIANNPIIP